MIPPASNSSGTSTTNAGEAARCGSPSLAPGCDPLAHERPQQLLQPGTILVGGERARGKRGTIDNAGRGDIRPEPRGHASRTAAES